MTVENSKKPTLVLIGNGMAGARLLEELATSCIDKFNIHVFGDEPYGNYNRIMLSPLLAGDKTLEEIMIHDRQWYQQQGFQLNTGPQNRIVSIDRGRQLIITESGHQIRYDRLVIATGSKPFILPIPGNELEGVISFRDIADVEHMINATQSYRHATVIGAGLLGLEAAMGLKTRGMDVTVVHSNATPLNRQLDAEAGALLQQQLSDQGINFLMNARTSKISSDGSNGNNHVTAVEFSDGRKLATDIVVMAIGIRPNIELAKQAKLYCQEGIVVSDTLQSYDPKIYALGECIQHRGETFGLVAPLYDQAKVLANHLSEHGVAQYQTLPTATKLKVTGIHVFSVGDFLTSDDSETLIYRDSEQAIYKKLVIKNNKLIGAVLYGDTLEGPFYNELIQSHKEISHIRNYLMFGRALCESMSKEFSNDQ